MALKERIAQTGAEIDTKVGGWAGVRPGEPWP